MRRVAVMLLAAMLLVVRVLTDTAGTCMLEAMIWKEGAGVWMTPETDWTVETTNAPLAVKVLVVMLPPWFRRVA